MLRAQARRLLTDDRCKTPVQHHLQQGSLSRHLRGGELGGAQRLLRAVAGLLARQAQHEGRLVVRRAAGRDAVA